MMTSMGPSYARYPGGYVQEHPDVFEHSETQNYRPEASRSEQEREGAGSRDLRRLWHRDETHPEEWIGMQVRRQSQHVQASARGLELSSKAWSSNISRTISRDKTASEDARQKQLLADWGRQGRFRDTDPHRPRSPSPATAWGEVFSPYNAEDDERYTEEPKMYPGVVTRPRRVPDASSHSHDAPAHHPPTLYRRSGISKDGEPEDGESEDGEPIER
ncbi:hypothetical protein LX36DRAFT_748089 [Colletotrichum falcatum]|nr:hypothetical protein LX36DRAFT_748089 [Colletotrichum falcatum]